jgi:hypothetical protein
MSNLLIRDGKLTIVDNNLIIINEGESLDCNCCGPGCPDKKICIDSQGSSQYPVPVNNFYIEVSGIPDTMSAEANYFYESEASGPGCVVCSYLYEKINTDFNYSLSGFSALNRRYEISEVLGNQCDDVCNPCVYLIKSFIVPLTGTFNRTQTSVLPTTTNGIMDCIGTNTTVSNINQVLCASAYITLSIVNNQYSFGISITSANNVFNHITPTRSNEYSYISLRSCNPPNPPIVGTSYMGDFIYFGFQTGPAVCYEQEIDGSTILSSPSFQCIGNSTNIETIQNSIWQDCNYFAERNTPISYQTNGFPCNGYVYTSTSFLRRGLNNFTAKIVRN